MNPITSSSVAASEPVQARTAPSTAAPQSAIRHRIACIWVRRLFRLLPLFRQATSITTATLI